MNEIYTIERLRPYCGYSIEEMHNKHFVNLGNGTYYETPYNNIDELKKSLLDLVSEKIMNEIVNGEVITDLNNVPEYSSYVMYNNKLYCRISTGKGYLPLYMNHYDINVDEITENKIEYTIKSYYAKDYNNSYFNSKTDDGNISSCTDETLTTKDKKFVIEKNNNNWIVTSYSFHD